MHLPSPDATADAIVIGTGLAGLVATAERVGFNRIAHMPDIDAIRRSRLKKKTLFAMEDSEDIVMARAEYMRLADTLWRSVQGEGTSPAPLPDREIFELLGFD